MSKRNDALQWMRIAGYHDDMREFMRHYTENRISLNAAKAAYSKGQQQKRAGLPCHCRRCATPPQGNGG